ncbi:MAG TPA: right-handed parallel beta-helix repeat-containing protein [Thermoleophilaceae bacterium]|nr:right-handed parallel beta-helix repeat-containing protein [Thermoleophilaceae bacterium]
MTRILGLALLLVALAATPALAHLERPSYWPDPTPDTSVSPPAGGKVPKARSLASAVTGKGPGEVRVVCQGKKSLKGALRSIKSAQKKGFRLRPSQPKIKYGQKKAKQMRKINRALFKECEYRSIQDAVTDSGNNDRIVIMPGRYTEPKSRKAPLNDPVCNPSMLQESQSGAQTPSYEYQATCENDQNLIHVTGRAVKGDPLPEPRPDRHGIPDVELGDCVRCNLQIEGSGAKPDDVILDAGRGYKKPMDPMARPGGDIPAAECRTEDDADSPCWSKHVVLRTDRSDGFVGRNFLMRGAREHGFYTEETDGALLDRVKFFWNADYGHLSFTSDHQMVQNCDGFGSGDAVIYPGASPQTGEFRDEGFYPEGRYNTVIRRCDLHGSAMGYSGSMGNSVRVTNNHFYGNANGLTTDTLSAGGHPGFPADGMKIDRNWFYANNLDVYREDSPFEALVPQPVGTGFFWPGNNDGNFSHNWVFDNWRQGAMLIAIPDAIAGTPEGERDPQTHCPTSEGDLVYSTSCQNRYFANRMGQVPPGFKPFPALKMFGNKTSLSKGKPETAANGVDFWWDEATATTGNCWYDNEGPDGTRDSLTADPPINPVADQSTPGFLPENCATSVGGNGYMAKVPGLLACFAQWESRELDQPGCTWWDTPPKPGTAAAASARRTAPEAQLTPSRALRDWVHDLAGQISYGPSS